MSEWSNCTCASCAKSPNPFPDDTYTATIEEQDRLKTAWRHGAKIEAKGISTMTTDYKWAEVKFPKWDFKNNYYRIKNDSNP